MIPHLAKSDSIEARCLGLVGQQAIIKATNKTIDAENAEKTEGPFYCPSCLSEVIVRKCFEKADHFAHKARYSSIVNRKEISLHNKCRDEICIAMKELFPEGKWESERRIKAVEGKNTKDLIPDISGRINNMAIAIEVQTSAYTINRIYEKTEEYKKCGVYVLWMVPLKTNLGEKFFRPRLFEKYLHSMYYGRIYYWYFGEGTKIHPVHFSPAKRYIEESTWFDSDIGDEKTVGGYDLTYKTIKAPNYGSIVDLSVDFKPIARKGFSPENVKKSIPPSLIFLDSLNWWWNKNEYKDVENQRSLKSYILPPLMVNNYEFLDEYDDVEII